MPVAETAPIGAPVWFDLFSSDTQAAQAFYEGVFEWTAEQMGPDYGNYVTFWKDGARVAGMMQNPGDGGPDGWTTYLKSADAGATAGAVTAAGGTMMVEPMDVMSMGRMGVAVDPADHVVGIWQPGTMSGYGVADEAGSPVWHELQTRDYAREVEFYENAFGWKTEVMSDTDDFRYTLLQFGEVDYAGVMDASGFPADAPTGWEVYIGATDVDATILRVIALGGTVVLPAEDTPFGRIAKIADPTGATIKLSSVAVH